MMLTQRNKARRSLRQVANRAKSQVASNAHGAVSGAGDAAKAVGTEMGKLPHQVSDRAGRTVTGARRATASRLFNTASRLSSAAEVVEHGRRPRRRRWPLVAALAAVVAATGVVVTKVARGLRAEAGSAGQDTTSGDSSQGEQPGRDGGDGERSVDPEAMGRISEPGEASRGAESVASHAATVPGHNDDGR